MVTDNQQFHLGEESDMARVARMLEALTLTEVLQEIATSGERGRRVR